MANTVLAGNMWDFVSQILSLSFHEKSVVFWDIRVPITVSRTQANWGTISRVYNQIRKLDFCYIV
jgi:hypothetical protein